jgi:hypothetical protein
VTTLQGFSGNPGRDSRDVSALPHIWRGPARRFNEFEKRGDFETTDFEIGSKDKKGDVHYQDIDLRITQTVVASRLFFKRAA